MKKSWLIVRQGTHHKFAKKGTYAKLKYPPSVVHFTSYDDALQEALRLASLAPGEDFMIYEAVAQIKCDETKPKCIARPPTPFDSEDNDESKTEEKEIE